MALDEVAFDAALQQHYTTRRIRDLAERNNPFFGMVRKNEKVGGNGMKTPLMFRNSTGGSGSYNKARDNAVEGGYAAFLNTHRDHFHVVKIGHKVMKLSSYKEAFFEAKKEIDRGINQATNALSRKMFGDRGGSVARMANSSFATTALQLVNIEDAYMFDKNEVITLGPNKDGSSERSGTLTISAVNRSTGVITTTANISTGIAAAAQNDYIFKEGDAAKGWTGLESYNPRSATDLSSNLLGVNQTTDPTRLGGYRLDATAMNIEEACIELAAQLSFEGANPDIALINPIRFKDLNLSVSAGRMGRREVKSTTGYVGYQAVTVMGPKGEISILPDTSCPPYDLRMGELATLELKSADEVPTILKEDGLMLHRDTTGTTIVFKVDIFAYGDLACEAPGYWGVAQLASTSA
jgi:hypothetical protein